MTLTTPYPTCGGEGHLRPFQGGPEASQKETATALTLLDYGANMQTPQTKLPQKETPPPQAHTPQETMMGLPEAHAADGGESTAPESFHSTASRSCFPICNLSQMNSCRLG